MSLRRPAKDQPDSFEFNASSLEAANSIVAKYPEGKQQSAVMALLYIAQRQNDNWIPLAAMKYIAKFLNMPYIKVYEVATFYSMYNLSPVGKYFVQVCTTTPCMIRGANKLVEACKEKISEKQCELSNDKSCSWMEVECLGACVNAPMMQINNDYYEDLDKEKTLDILNKILKGETPKPGSYRGRVNNEPENNRKTLIDLKNASPLFSRSANQPITKPKNTTIVTTNKSQRTWFLNVVFISVSVNAQM